MGLYVASPAVAQGPVNISPEVEVAFRVEDTTLRTSSPVVKTALHTLGLRWPQAMSFKDLYASVLAQWQERNFMPEAPEKMEQNLATNLIHGFTRGIAQFYAAPPKVKNTLDGAPRTSALARLQAASDNRITSLLHTMVQLNEIERAVLILADGTRNREDIFELLVQDAVAGKLKLPVEDGKTPSQGAADTALAAAPPSEEEARARVGPLVDKGIFTLTQLALVCG
jgi:methyltransferase-like protein